MRRLPSSVLLRILQKIRPIELGEFLKQLCGITYQEYVVGDLRLSLDPAGNLGRRLLTEGTHERERSRAIEEMLQPGDIFVDVGANEGWFSLLAARRVGPDGRVFAVEPQERLWPVLLRNLSLNRIGNVSLLPYALGAQDGEIELALHPSLNPGATTAVIDWRRRHFRRQKATLTTLDSLAATANWSRIRLMKIDVEGYELQVLRGAKQLLADRRIEYLVVEVHAAQILSSGDHPAEVSAILTSHGYRQMPAYQDCWTSLA